MFHSNIFLIMLAPFFIYYEVIFFIFGYEKRLMKSAFWSSVAKLHGIMPGKFELNFMGKQMHRGLKIPAD